MKEAMEIRNLKQADLVEKTGISKGALSSYISGKYAPKQTNTYLIARALEVDPTWLMGYDVPMEPNNDGSISSYELAHIINKIRKDKNAQELLNIYYNNLDDDNRKRILDLARALGNH